MSEEATWPGLSVVNPTLPGKIKLFVPHEEMSTALLRPQKGGAILLGQWLVCL